MPDFLSWTIYNLFAEAQLTGTGFIIFQEKKKTEKYVTCLQKQIDPLYILLAYTEWSCLCFNEIKRDGIDISLQKQILNLASCKLQSGS